MKKEKQEDISVKFLLKFGEEENINNLFHKGEIYMNTLKWFRACEKRGTGDKLDGVANRNELYDGVMKIHLEGGKDVDLRYKNLTYSENHNCNIYSTYAISDLLLKQKEIHLLDKKMKNFGSHCLLIKSPKEFIDLISNELEIKNIPHQHNLVQYREIALPIRNFSPYIKSHRFSYQNEHRIIAEYDKDEPLILKVGSLKKIAKIYETQKLVDTLVVFLK